jgi:cysteine desulfurase
LEIYLDNCATTRVCEEAVDACVHAMSVDYGNPSSLHKMGVQAEQILSDTRRLIGKMLGCDPGCILFTGSATESNNLAILGSAAAYPRAGKKIVTTSVEHASVENSIAFLEEEGYSVCRIAPHSDGNFDPADFLNAVDSDTFLLSLMMVNNETGTILPLRQIIPPLKKRFPKLLIHVDAVQGFAKYPLNLKQLDLDFVTFSGHKLYAPKGIGVLYVKKGIRLKPLIHGGGQEKGLRSGTQSVPLIAALNAALQLCDTNRDTFRQHYQDLNAHLREGLAKLDGIAINSPENGAPHLLNISVMGVPSEIMLHFLETKEIFVSSGSACAKGAQSSVLAAYGLPTERIRSALRISFSKDNTIADIDALLTAIAEGQQRFLKFTTSSSQGKDHI